MVEVLVHQAGVSFQEVGVQRLHDEADGVSIQLGTKELGERLRGRGGQQVGAGRRVSAAASRVQSLAKLVGVGRPEVDGGGLSSVAGPRDGHARCFLVSVNLGKAETRLRVKGALEERLQLCVRTAFVGRH